jgi:hypothetical protein
MLENVRDANKQTVLILNSCCIKYVDSIQLIKLVLIFYQVGFENIQETNSALYSLRSGLPNEVSLGIPFHLKKKVRGGCALLEGDMQKPYAPNPLSGFFFTKITYEFYSS